MVKVLVETVSVMRHRYVIETPDDHPEYALDVVTCNEAEEVSQQFIDELITSHRIVTDEEYLKMFDEDNDYLKRWPDTKKLSMITRIKE